MMKRNLFIFFSLALILVSFSAHADNEIKDNEFNPVNTGVTTLSIAPDARGSSMGNLGAATDPDMNSQFWNPSKYAFGYSTGGLSLSYTPWLRKIVNDIFLAQPCRILETRKRRQSGSECVATLFLSWRSDIRRF